MLLQLLVAGFTRYLRSVQSNMGAGLDEKIASFLQVAGWNWCGLLLMSGLTVVAYSIGGGLATSFAPVTSGAAHYATASAAGAAAGASSRRPRRPPRLALTNPQPPPLPPLQARHPMKPIASTIVLRLPLGLRERSPLLPGRALCPQSGPLRGRRPPLRCRRDRPPGVRRDERDCVVPCSSTCGRRQLRPRRAPPARSAARSRRSDLQADGDGLPRGLLRRRRRQRGQDRRDRRPPPRRGRPGARGPLPFPARAGRSPCHSPTAA